MGVRTGVAEKKWSQRNGGDGKYCVLLPMQLKVHSVVRVKMK